MKDLKARLTSRKLWMALLAALVVFLNKFLDLDLKFEEVSLIVTALLGFVAVEGGNDIIKTLKK